MELRLCFDLNIYMRMFCKRLFNNVQAALLSLATADNTLRGIPEKNRRMETH